MATTEPWLDSLSDEWASSKHSSSPVYSTVNPQSRAGSRAGDLSQSRIPHLSQNNSQSSRNGSFLRPRSSKGLARAQTSPVLGEQTSSKSNVVAQMANLDGRSTLPRRASSAFSGSLNSVQHHTAQKRSSIGDENIPEWKRRLARGEDIAGDGCDLFGPTRLEGIFKQPPSVRDRQEKTALTAAEPTKPWSMPEQYQSMRASRSKIPEMEVLAEEDEGENDYDAHGAKFDSTRTRSLRGVVKDRVLSLEYQNVVNSPSESRTGSVQRDPRTRTSSGLEEIKNEEISPITTSRQNTIREQAIRRLTEVPASALELKLEDMAERPSSRSSDDGVLYGHDVSRGEDLGEMTSLSLPDDLSMGTQDFATRGGFINSRRGGRSNDGSFQKKTLSSSVPPSLEQSAVDFQNMPFRSSPPPYNPTTRPSQECSTAAKPSPTTPRRPSGSDGTDRPRSSGSPLKLFGNYDTFTNDKLLRRLSQFEREEAEATSGNDETSHTHDDQEDMRISHFGKGDLDRFAFNESIERQPIPVSSRLYSEPRIFESSGVDEEIAQAVITLANSGRHARERFEQETPAIEVFRGETKRVPSPSIKDRTPKRRRTLLLSELEFTQEAVAPEPPARSINVDSRLAGKKRKDARYGDAESAADPATIASRQMLQPRPARPRTSFLVATANASEDQRLETGSSEDKMTEELAGELASYGIGITQMANDSRKPSVTTQDFLNEATKIMQIIRQRGKPKSGLSSVQEPREEAEIDPDSILDLDVEGEDTTLDNFSRPPSRNGSMKVRRERMALQDSSVVNLLQKYQDGDELDLLITSKLGSLHLLPEPHAREADVVPLPDDDDGDDDDDESGETVSSPANIRVRESGEQQRKRKHSTSTLANSPSPPTHASSGTSTGTTIPTSSSANSANKGRIPPGMVLVPEQVGVMTFDHTTKSWVRAKGQKAGSPSSRKENSEEDPLGEIPDLSIDEQQEAARNALAPGLLESAQEGLLPPIVPGPVPSSRPQTREGAQILTSETASGGTKFTRSNPSMPGADTRATSWATVDSPSRSKAQASQSLAEEQYSDHNEEVEHEIRIHDGRASEAPPSPHRLSKKARAVTIAFSSPLVSAIAYHNERTHSDSDHSVLSVGISEDVSVIVNSSVKTASIPQGMQSSASGKLAPPFNGRTFIGRPVSRIDEQDEENAVADLSVVHVSHSNAMTPAPKPAMTGPVANSKGASIICLTPLSEFSLHQVDHRRHLEASYVAQRAHPTSLQQAHGSLALAVDELMKAITDAEPYELYWEHIRRLDLTEKRLTTLHSLEEYCSAAEELRVSGNELGQLSGVPGTVRTLLAQNNRLSSLTSWGHLQNLQYLDISGNVLESLDGLSCLVHLRELKANDNRIRNLEGILDLNGLLHLELQANELASVDFEGGELTRLHHLDLSNNQLTGVRHVDALPALRTLYLERNQLGGFGAPNEQYTMLGDLRLSCNHIEIIDLACIPSIEILYLDHNRIQSIHGLSTARHLNTLSIREQSNSPSLLNTVLSESNECRKLYLSNNSAPPEGLKMSAFPHLNLRYLELASCGLTSLPHDFGKKIPNCRTLNLNFNAVKDVQSLKTCGRLNKLMLAGNRLNKLRRTCMILTRLPALTKIDLRDNPLTVGFYPPFWERRLVIHGDVAAGANVQDPYALPPVDQALDSKWISHLDEGTRLKRRTIELFLAKGCEKLVELDGLSVDRVAFLQRDEIWRKLASVGVLKRPSRSASSSHGLDDEAALPLDAEGYAVVDDRERILCIE
jgi:protein NUD1